MSTEYFSERIGVTKPRTVEVVDENAWGGIVALIHSRIDDASFGLKFPLNCQDGKGVYGCNEHNFYLALLAEHPELGWPLSPGHVPKTLAVLDLLEFCHRIIAKPKHPRYDHYCKHRHLQFDIDEGRQEFRGDVNRILARNGLAYGITEDGLIVRLIAEELDAALKTASFATGDSELQGLLLQARAKFMDPDPEIRKEALEKLWDAWERLKTVEPAKDKKASIAALLEKTAAEQQFRAALDAEGCELTRIGNTFRIRHSEVTQIQLQSSEHVDYLFHRMFALIRLCLRATGRAV